jgi:group I intron endonuclease
MSKKFNYVYITTNSVNGKQYVGDHSSNKLEDNYIGSGNIIVHAVNKYGKEKFKKEILEFFDTKQEAFNAQEKWINACDTLKPNGYNISPKGGHNVGGCFSEETLEKLRIGGKNHIKTSEHKRKISEGVKKALKEKKFEMPSWEGKTHSNETKNKMRKSHTGKKMSDESKEKNRQKHLKENLPARTKKNMSEGAKKRWENYRNNKN